MLITLSNQGYTIAVESLGAELKSYKNEAGKEFIWNSNPDFWPRSSPLLVWLIVALYFPPAHTLLLWGRGGTAVAPDETEGQFHFHGDTLAGFYPVNQYFGRHCAQVLHGDMDSG